MVQKENFHNLKKFFRNTVAEKALQKYCRALNIKSTSINPLLKKSDQKFVSNYNYTP